MDRYRSFGGQYVPESLVECLEKLQETFEHCWNNIDFLQEFAHYLAILRPPTDLQHAPNLTRAVGGAQIYLKREDKNVSGSHCITNALGQVMLARHLGKTTVIAETGSGGHGVATAIVCQMFGMRCMVYMGSKDVRNRPDQVKRIKEYGAEVIEAAAGEGDIRQAVTEVLRASVELYESAYPLLGGAYGPRPIPRIAKAFQSLAGAEVKKQILNLTGDAPGAIVAYGGIHSPAAGLFDLFIDNQRVELVVSEGAGHGMETKMHSAALVNGTPGVYHGAHTMLLQDDEGQIPPVHSMAPDLCYPGSSPTIAKWVERGRVEAAPITDYAAALACMVLARAEGINCSIEDGHAIVSGIEVAKRSRNNDTVVVCLGGGA